MDQKELEQLSAKFDLSDILLQILISRAQIEALTDYLTKNATKDEKLALNKAINDKTMEIFKSLCEAQKKKKGDKEAVRLLMPEYNNHDFHVRITRSFDCLTKKTYAL
jgi:hypothetical protein